MYKRNKVLQDGNKNFVRTSRLLVISAVIIAVIIIILGTLNYLHTRSTISRNAYINLENISNAKLANIQYWRNDKIDDAVLLMREISHKTFLSDYAEGKSDKNTLLKWMKSLLIHSDLTEFIFYDLNKNPLLSTDKEEKLTEKEKSDAFEQCILQKKVIMSDFYYDSLRKNVRISVFIPVYKSNDDVSGTLMVEYNPVSSLQTLISKMPDNSSSSEAYIIRKSSDDALVLTQLKGKNTSALNYRISKSDSEKVSVKAANGFRGRFEGIDYAGNNVLAFIQEIPGSNWILITKINYDEAESNPVIGNTLIILITLLLVFLALLVTYIYNKKNQEKYFRQLYNEQVSKNIQLERFNVLLQNANDNIMLYDEEGKCVDANQKALDTYGYTLEEIKKLHVADIRAPEARTDIKKLINSLKNREGIVFETLHITKSGKIFPVEISSTRIDFDGKIYLQGITRDISYRKEFQDKILESEEKFKSVFTYANDVMLIMDNMNFVDVNRNAEILFGYTKEQMLKKTPADISPEYQDDGISSKTKSKEYVEKALKGEPQFFEWIHKTSSGTEFPTEVSLNAFTINKKVMVFAVIRDITFRKVLDKSIKEKEKSLELALDGSELGYYDMSLFDGKVITNETCYKMLGYDENDVLPERDWWRSIIHPDDIEISNTAWFDYLSGKTETYSSELRMRSKDGKYRWILDKSKVFEVNSEGIPLRVVGTHMDITQRKLYEEAILKAKEAAEESNKLKSNFLTNMSHELRTPLTGILGFSELLLTELENEDHKEMVDLILRGGKRLTATLNSILDLSRLESNQLDPVKDKINIVKIAEEAVANFKIAAKNKNLELHFETVYQTVECHIDEKMLNDICFNLIQNAITYTARGEIKVKVYTLKKKGKEYAAISVKDTGIGIAKKYHNQIFEPFRQASEGLSRKFEGTGLGLTLTRKYAEMLDGDITLISEEGNGAEFIVSFPLIQSVLITENTASEGTIKGTGNNLTALFVEDEIESFELVRMLLKSYIKVENVTSSREALNLIKDNKYDIIFMDIGLKEMNGMELTRRIRKIGNYENIPIIAITAFAMEGDKEKILESGCTDYISKPFNRQTLLSVVGKYTNVQT